jgi:hypothetical protein
LAWRCSNSRSRAAASLHSRIASLMGCDATTGPESCTPAPPKPRRGTSGVCPLHDALTRTHPGRVYREVVSLIDVLPMGRRGRPAPQGSHLWRGGFHPFPEEGPVLRAARYAGVASAARLLHPCRGLEAVGVR